MYTIVLSILRDTPEKDAYVLKMGKNMHEDGMSVILPLDLYSINRGFSSRAHFQIVSRHAVAFLAPYDKKFYGNIKDYIEQIKMTHAAQASLPIMVPADLLKDVSAALSGQGASLHGYHDDPGSLSESIKNLSSCRKVFFMPAPL